MSNNFAKYLELETLQAQISGIIGICMENVPVNYDNDLVNALWAAQDLCKRAESALAELRTGVSDDSAHDAWNEGFNAGLECLLSEEEDDSGEDYDDEEEDEEAEDDGADRFHSAVIILINAQEEE
jgi:hypothetical protein